MKHMPLVLLLGLSVAAGACLQKETTSTIYLRPDGSFDWVILERNVRSDETDADKRLAEEDAWVGSVDRGEHPVAVSFLALGGGDVRLRWLRSARPYAVMIDARFDSLAGMFDQRLTGCAIPHSVSTEEVGGVATWRLWMDVGIDGEDAGRDVPEGCDRGLDGLSDALDDLHIVLESGSFTAASGFTLEGTDTAVVDEAALERAVRSSGRIDLSLSWKLH